MKKVFLISKIKRRTKRSFTLVELLVVTAVILIITGGIIVNYRRGGGLDLQFTTVSIFQEIKEVEEMALAVKRIDGEIPEEGYGLSFSSSKGIGKGSFPVTDSSYIIYIDKNGNGKYDRSSLDKIVKKIEIGKDVEVSNVYPSDPLSIIFFPPDPRVKINNDFDNFYAQITLEKDGETKTIYINKIGLITIE